jgi:hypothetical protein
MFASCAVLLFAYQRIKLQLRQGHVLDEHEDADLYYEALREFGCVNFFFETYGGLFRGTNDQRQAMMGVNGNWSIIRFDDHGRLLATQRPGSSFNWRSAWRGAVRLPGLKWVEILLFHTRYTPSDEALANVDERTAKNRTLKMRSDSVVNVAQTVLGGWCVPIAFFGDFNLPMTENSHVLTQFAGRMQGMGYRRQPAQHVLSTMCVPETIARERDDYYSQAYDAAYVHDIPDGHCNSRILDIRAIGGILGDDLVGELKPYVAEFYQSKLRKLCSKLRKRRTRLIDNLPRNVGVRNALIAILRDVAAAGGVLALLLCEHDAYFGSLETALGARLLAFQGRPLFENASDDDLEQDVMVVLAEKLRAIEDDMRWPDLDSRCQRNFRDLAAKLEEARVILDNIDCQYHVRIAIGYTLVVSDHLPLVLWFDLDRPL